MVISAVAGATVGTELKVAAANSGGWSGARMDEAGDKLSAIRTASFLVPAGVVTPCRN